MAAGTSLRPALLGLAILLSAGTGGAFAQQRDTEWHRIIDSILGRPGAEQPGGIWRVALPRTDLKVTVDGVELRPAFALGSWLAFQPHGDMLMVMGDLVLQEREVAPVMRRLAAGGIEVTALHNHLLRTEPATVYLHVHGRGDAAHLATALRAALQESGTPLRGEAATGGAGSAADLDTGAIARALGREGRAAGGVYSVSVPRAGTIREAGTELPPAFGVATAINFQPAGSGRAAVTGDFVLTVEEVVPVQQALLENGIEVTALHTHMLNEQPRLFFLHFWAVGEPEALARGLRAALGHTGSRPEG